MAALVARIGELRDRGTAPAIVLEAAVLIEAGWAQAVDEVWLVVAGKANVHQRLSRDRGMTDEQIAARERAQLTDEQRRQSADVVIENDGSLAELEAKVTAAWQGAIAA